MKVEEWLGVLESDYLATYLPAGGSTVRFLTGAPEVLDTTRRGLFAAAAERGLLAINVDSATTKIHQVQELFFAVSRQVDWAALTSAVARQATRESGYTLPDGDLSYHAIAAAAAGSEWMQVREDIRDWLRRNVFRDYQMVAEFRQAVMALLDDALDGGSERAERSALVLEWLRGELRLMGGLRSAGIYQKITRSNARDMFVSLCHWVRKAGIPGMVVFVDINAYTVARRADATGNFYTRPACLEMYEVARQFIDATDAMEGCALVLAAPHGWPFDDVRGLRAYRALAYRVSEEARDATRENPVAMLIRLE